MNRRQAIDAMDAAMDLGHSVKLRGASRPNMIPSEDYTVKLELRSGTEVNLEELMSDFASSEFKVSFTAWPDPALGGFYLIPND